MERALALKHRPIVYLHPDEKYFPIEFNRYIDEARLKNVKTGAIFKPEDAFDSTVFGQWLFDHPEVNSQDYTLFLPNGLASECIAKYQPTTQDLASVPLYVNYRTAKSTLFISYTFMYAYNGPEPVCCFKFGEHYADSEHVTAKISISRYGDVTFSALYNSRHNGGVWVEGPELGWHDDRPLVFSSLNGHASYNQPGNHRRYWGVAIDRCSCHGPVWDSNNLVFLPESWQASAPDLRWTLFRGSLGDGHVDGFGNKSYLTSDDVNGEYGASNCPCEWQQ